MRFGWSSLVLGFVSFGCALGVACGGGDDNGGSGGPIAADAAPPICEPGEIARDGRCVAVGAPICAEADATACGAARGCADGTIDFLGEPACAPVGITACPEGFARQGFACAPVVAASCAGATRARLGDAACVPVGDCDAAFPPPGATMFVDAAFTAGQIDATHKKTIQEAVDAAPAGAVVAVAPGTYAGAVILSRQITLAGKCARDVILSGAASSGMAGITTDASRIMRVSGVTITGFEPGVDAHGGATLTLASVVVEKNKRSGIAVADKGTKVTVTGSAVRDNLPDASSRFGQGVVVGFDGQVTIEDSDLDHNGEMAVNALKAGAATVTRSVLRRSVARAGNGAYGWGVGAQSAGSFELVGSLVADVVGGGAVAVEKGTKGVVRGSTITGVGPGATSGGGSTAACALAQLEGALTIEGATLASTDGSGIASTDSATTTVRSTSILGPLGTIEGTAGVLAAKKGTVDVDGLAIVDPKGIGALISDTGKLTGKSLLVRRAQVSALAVKGTSVLERVVLEDTRAGTGAGGSYGAGVYVDTKGRVELSGALVRGSAGIGVITYGPGSAFELHGGAVVRSLGGADLPGSGVTANKGAQVLLERAAVLGQPGLGVHATDEGTFVEIDDCTLGDALLAGPRDRGRALNVQDGARATVSRTALVRAGEVAITAIGAGAAITAADVLVASTVESPNAMAHGGVAAEGARLDLVRARIRDQRGAGLIFAGGGGLVQNTRIERNGVGVQATSSSKLVDAAAAPDAFEPGSVYVLSDTRFEGNQTKVGGDELPVPGRVLVK